MARSLQCTQNLCLSLSLSLSLSHEPSHVSRNGSTSKQNKAHTTLPAAEEAQQQVAPRLWIRVLASMCLLVQSATQAPAGSSTFRQHAGCTVRSPPPLSPNHGATWFLRRPVFHMSRRPMSHGRTVSLRLLRLSSNCSQPWFRRTIVVTFCVRASHPDVYPELLQDAREPGEHI